MAPHGRDEVAAAHDRYIQTRSRIEAGEIGWDALAELFTDDATFVDPAWGRIQGKGAIGEFLVKSMVGLDGWSFPHEWCAIEGDRVVAAWQNRLPGQRPDGSHFQALGISVMIYAGGGLFSSEEDLLNMVHVMELIEESGWKPGPQVNMPPPRPHR